MEFTPHETKLIERLRKQERRWPRTRWILLAVGIFAAVCYTYVLVSLVHSLNFEELHPGEVLYFAMLWPKCLMGWGFAAWFLAWAIRDWHGNVHRMLLLRLLEAQQKEPAQ